MSRNETDDPLLDDARFAHQEHVHGTAWPTIAELLHCSVSHAQRLARYYQDQTDATATFDQFSLF